MIFRLKKFATKRGLNRQPGECDQLLNTTPMRVTGSEKTRYGYSSAGLPALPTGITADYYKYASTENPSAKEVLFLFGHETATPANQHVYMYSYVAQGASTWTDGWVLIDEHTASVTIGGVTGATDNDFTVAGLSSTNDYYNGWIAVHATKGTVYITNYVGSSTTLTCLENIGSDGLNWVNGETVTLYRWNHGNPTFDPAFTFPSVKTDQGIFKVKGGMGSTVGYKDLWVGYINRTFFAGEAEAFTYQGTYVTERECKAVVLVHSSTGVQVISGSEVALDTGFTYWIAVEAIYDGYQHGKLYELGGDYNDSGSNKISGDIQPYASLDKRITGFNLYVAQDQGDTTLTGRINPYRRFKTVPLTDSTFTDWVYTGSVLQRFVYSFKMDKTLFDLRDNRDRLELTGYVDGTDTIYSSDVEVSLGDRNWIGRVYRYTDGKQDLDNIYTNPKNEFGESQPDIFSDEPDEYRFRVLFGDSSYLNGIVPTARGTILALKDRGVAEMQVTEQSDNTLLVETRVVSLEAGCASKTGYVKTPFGEIFFAGYDDIYRYTGELQVLTRDDWEDVYRVIATADKQACLAWYRHDEKALFFQFGENASDHNKKDAYAFYLSTSDWRQVLYAVAMTSYTVKRDSTVVWMQTDGTVYKFDTSADDAGTAIVPQWKSGNMRLTKSDEIGVLDHVYINKPTVSSTAGAEGLICKVKSTLNGVETTLTFSGCTQSATRLWLPTKVDDVRKFDWMSIEYNQPSAEANGENGVVEFGDVEVEFETLPKSRFS